VLIDVANAWAVPASKFVLYGELMAVGAVPVIIWKIASFVPASVNATPAGDVVVVDTSATCGLPESTETGPEVKESSVAATLQAKLVASVRVTVMLVVPLVLASV
jgi:hypothetical protein